MSSLIGKLFYFRPRFQAEVKNKDEGKNGGSSDGSSSKKKKKHKPNKHQAVRIPDYLKVFKESLKHTHHGVNDSFDDVFHEDVGDATIEQKEKLVLKNLI